MEVKINQVVLHLLDPGASEPVLSDRAMDMDADLYEYYTATLERAFASDEVKNCRFLPDSAFAAEMAQNQDFIDLSRRIAGVIFEQMLQYQAIPAGDLAVVDFTADGVPFYGVLKLNYRPGYTHHTELMGNGRFSSMVPQRTLLPGTPKADEAALIDRANGTVRLIEKKFTLDDRKDFYLSTRVFGCTEALQEKAKLKAVCETAVAAVKEAYPSRRRWTMCPRLTAAPRLPLSCWCATRPWTTRSPSRTCASASGRIFPWPPPSLRRRWPRPACRRMTA